MLQTPAAASAFRSSEDSPRGDAPGPRGQIHFPRDCRPISQSGSSPSRSHQQRSFQLPGVRTYAYVPLCLTHWFGCVFVLNGHLSWSDDRRQLGEAFLLN